MDFGHSAFTEQYNRGRLVVYRSRQLFYRQCGMDVFRRAYRFCRLCRRIYVYHKKQVADARRRRCRQQFFKNEFGRCRRNLRVYVDSRATGVI